MWIINSQKNEKDKFTCNNLPMFTRSFFRIVFLNLFVKFCAMYRIQNTCTQFPSVQLLLGLLNTAQIELWQSDIKHKFCWGVTCVLRFLRKKNQASAISPSTIANAIGKILFLSSCAIATIRVPLYIMYRKVPSTCTIGLQNGKPSMHGLNVHNTFRKCCWFSRTSSPFVKLVYKPRQISVHGL